MKLQLCPGVHLEIYLHKCACHPNTYLAATNAAVALPALLFEHVPRWGSLANDHLRTWRTGIVESTVTTPPAGS